MRLRRFASRSTPQQARRRGEWEQYMAIGAWHHRRRAWLASSAANTTCPGCGTAVGKQDDVHHLAYPSVPGAEADTDLVLLCRPCHEAVHASLDASPGWRRASRRTATWAILARLRSRVTPNDRAPRTARPLPHQLKD